MSGEGLKEACGLFGILNHPEAARLAYLGLYALQHRGEESAGIVSSDGKEIHSHKGMGLVGDVFSEETLELLPGNAAIGHVRYSTTGSSHLRNAQPLLDDSPTGSLAVAHNGNLVNAAELRAGLEAQGISFQSTVDSEVILQLIARADHATLDERIIEGAKKLLGAFSLVMLTEDRLIGLRDPQGFRPLLLGRFDGAHVLASETCALDLIGAKLVREIEPGEIVFLDAKGVRSVKYVSGTTPAHCLFEHVYFARPDSVIFGDPVEEVRYRLGKQLAQEHPAKADLVMPVPDSGNFAALGFSHESGIPFAWGMVRNHYIGRTFIQPQQKIRDFKVRVKLNPLRHVLEGKRVIVVDDSIIRGTTSKSRIRSIREAGATEVHMRISCPPTKHPCFYGIDFPTEEELIAATHSLEEIRKFLNADTLGYISIEGMLKAVSGNPSHYCTACWSGQYPTKIPSAGDKFVLEKKC
ncbi:MAG: amidophosphoribosyltransferase [Candidatus Omnitrophica bacterium]|nr:amidophosphoribosyltransferase [Candidatus Omnitrophota bacterium]